jgi:hypothetical protein
VFGTKTRRGMAVGALVISLSATTLVGNAAASPVAETHGCSALAHERNAGAHRLHEAWRIFSDQLRDLSRQARELARDARRSGNELTVDAREDIAAAKGELSAIRTAAHAVIQDKVELGSACKDEVVTETADPNTTLAAPVDTDVDEEDETVLDTSDLVTKYREVVDAAITDMQAVMDPLNAAVAEMLAAAETAETSDDTSVKEKRGKAKAEREEKVKSGKPEGAGKPADAGKGKTK